MRPLLPSWAGLIAVFAVGSALAATPVVELAGDGGAARVRLENGGVHPVEAALGPVGRAGPTVAVPGYGRATWYVQCVDGSGGPAPALEASVDGHVSPLEVSPVAFPDGLPAVWISRARTGRADLAAIIGEAIGGGPVPLRHVAPADSPTWFGAMRFATHILIGVSELSDLSDAQVGAVRGAVAAGATLVIDAGEGEVASDLLATFLPVRLGEVVRSGPALLRAVPKAVARRTLSWVDDASGIIHERVRADGAPVVLDGALGLGRVRVVGIRFADLHPGVVASAAFEFGRDGLGGVLSWFGRLPPAPEARRSPISAAVWWALIALLALVFVGRWRPNLIGIVGPVAIIGVAFVPPIGAPVVVTDAHIVYVPIRGGALVFGALDVALDAGGGRLVDAGIPGASLETAEPGGVCVAAGPAGQRWLLSGDPGEHRRVTWVTIVDTLPAGSDDGETWPEWPPGALAGAEIRSVAGPATLPLAIPAIHASAKVLVLRPDDDPGPVAVLAAPVPLEGPL